MFMWVLLLIVVNSDVNWFSLKISIREWGHEVEAASQPSSTQGLESAHIDSNPNPDSEPDVILIEEYKKEKEDK